MREQEFYPIAADVTTAIWGGAEVCSPLLRALTLDAWLPPWHHGPDD
jgi:hypothetical protein